MSVWDKRDLIKELVLKDLKIRYSRPILGFLWAFLSPFLIVGVFYLVFSLILKVQTEEAPFFLYLMSAVFPWQFFHNSVMSSTTSLVDNKNLIKEGNFPNYLIPVSIVMANLINFLPSLLILMVISFCVLKGFSGFIVFLPAVLAIQIAITISLSVLFSVLYVKFRDLKYVLEILLLLIFYLTPAVYSLQLVKNSFTQLLFRFYINNPFVGLISMYRAVFLKGFYYAIKRDIGLLSLIIAPVGFGIISLFLSFYFYGKYKDRINDHLSY